jgi:hypothetical protein
MTKSIDRTIARDALGFTLVAGGLVWLLAATSSGGEVVPQDAGYLSSVLSRSLANPFQGALLAGFLAVIPHFVWVWVRQGSCAETAYDTFGGWAQTLFTSLGFLGTIVGVSLAVGGLEDAMLDGSPAALIGGLSTAFDTTFIGLASAILLMFCRKLFSLAAAQSG